MPAAVCMLFADSVCRYIPGLSCALPGRQKHLALHPRTSTRTDHIAHKVEFAPIMVGSVLSNRAASTAAVVPSDGAADSKTAWGMKSGTRSVYITMVHAYRSSRLGNCSNQSCFKQQRRSAVQMHTCSHFLAGGVSLAFPHAAAARGPGTQSREEKATRRGHNKGQQKAGRLRLT